MLARGSMKTAILGSLSVMSLVVLGALTGCSPALSQPKASTDLDTATSTVSLTSAEALPANRAPLEPWGDAPAAAAPAPLVQTWHVSPQNVEPAAPVMPTVKPLDPWSYP